MGLFGIPKIPPELMGLLANPGELGKQVKAFYVAATDLLRAIDVQRKLTAMLAETPLDSDTEALTEALSNADLDVWAKADAFRVELNKLPPLEGIVK